VDPEKRPQILNAGTKASDPGQVRLSHAKLRALLPLLYDEGEYPTDRAAQDKQYLEEQLQFGDSRAAVVISVAPLLVAAYSDELDCVAMLRFPDRLAAEYRLSEGSRLLTVNTYGSPDPAPEDLLPGPGQFHRYTGFHPVIAEFVSEDGDRIEARKREIGEEEWERTLALGRAYAQLRPGVARDGRPLLASKPASVATDNPGADH
jgi:hypothetical protein